jgi:hypothetical protein
MINRKNGALRQIKNCVFGLAIGAAACLLMAPAASAQAQSQTQTWVSLQSSSPLVVGNDRGGRLRVRLTQLGELRKSRRPVKITGAICYSTCTMFLGLPQTCISPNTTFGFHGPSSYGRALDPTTFNRASRVIASYYPQALRTWFMETGRYKINSVYKVKGREIIKMGIRAC